MEDEVIVNQTEEPTITTTSEDVLAQQSGLDNTSGENQVTSTDTTNVGTDTNVGTTSGEIAVNPDDMIARQTSQVTTKDDAVTVVEDLRYKAYDSRPAAIGDWIRNSYDYDAREAGTYWIAAKIHNPEVQLSFLEATLNEDLYGEMDLQKYYFDQNLATARNYAKQKKFETAYGYYRAAQEKALAEGQLTGFYLPAEANYMLGQWAVADANLNDPNLGTMDKARAEQVRDHVSEWFAANNISPQGIEVLNSLYLKETIRHNQENERLQAQANEIQRKQNAANAAASGSGSGLAEKEFEFNLAQLELQWGLDFDDNAVIGYADEEWKDLGTYESQQDWAIKNISKAIDTWGTDYIKVLFNNPDKYSQLYEQYEGIKDREKINLAAAEGSNLIPNLANKAYDSDGKAVKIKVPKDLKEKYGVTDGTVYKMAVYGKNNELETRLYLMDDNDNPIQITNIDGLKTTKGKTLVETFSLGNNKVVSTPLTTRDGTVIYMGDAKRKDTYAGSVTANKKYYEKVWGEEVTKEVSDKEAEGYIVSKGNYAKKDGSMIMEKKTDKGTEYIKIKRGMFGKVSTETVKERDVKATDTSKWQVGKTITTAQGALDNKNFIQMSSAEHDAIVSTAISINTEKGFLGAGEKQLYMYVDGNNKVWYLKEEGAGTAFDNFAIVDKSTAASMAKVSVDTIDDMATNLKNYYNDEAYKSLTKQATKLTSVSEDVKNINSKQETKDNAEKASANASKNIKTGTYGASSSSSPARNIPEPTENKFTDKNKVNKVTKKESDKNSEQEFLESLGSDNTWFAQNQIEAQLEKLKKQNSNQFLESINK